MVDRRNIFESKLQELVRKVWDDARKYGDGLRYAGVDKKVFLDRYDYDIHELLISYLDGPASDVGAQDEISEEGEMGDGVRQEDHIKEFWEGFAKGIYDESAALRANGALQRAAEQIKGIYKTPGRRGVLSRFKALKISPWTNTPGIFEFLSKKEELCSYLCFSCSSLEHLS